MKKKIIMVLAMVLLAFSASASDWTPLITNLDTHPEILWGFCPVYIEGGVSYDGFELIEDRETRLQLIVGGGYGQRKLWQDPVTGESTEKIWDQPLTYDVGFANWALKFIQGFWESPWDPGSDLLQLSVAYEGRYEYNMDSRVAGETRANFGDPKEVLTLDQFLGKEGSSVYPDLLGNRQYLGTNFNLNLKFDLMTDEIIENVEDVIGFESLNHFGEYEDDSVYVRNERLRVDYEVLLDLRTYTEVLESKPYLRR